MSTRSFGVVLTARIDQYEAAMRRAQQSTENFTGQSSQRIEQFGMKAQAVGGWMRTRVTLPIVAAGAAGVKMAVDFDSSMTRIQSLVGLSASEVDGMRDSVMSLSGDTATAPKELADALFFATSAGLESAEALEAVEWAAKASAVGLGDTSTIVDLTTSAMNAYGADVLGAAEATDVLTAAVRLGKLEPSQLAGAMGHVLPVASAMGVGFDEVGAAFAAMSRTGTNASQAATQLRGIMATLLSPSKEARDALAGVGLSVEGIQDSLRNDGLLATLEMMVGSLGDNVTASEAVFGNVRALSGVMDMLGSNVDGTRQIFDQMSDTAGITAEAFDITSQSVGFRMAQAWTDFKVALMTAGEIILPMVTQITEFIGHLASRFTELPGPAQTALVVVMGLLAAAGPLLLVLGSMAKNITMLTAAFTALRAAMIAHPILALATVATAVGTALYFMGGQASDAEKRIDAMADAMIRAGDASQGISDRLTEMVMASDELARVMRASNVTVDDMTTALQSGDEAWARVVDKLVAGAEASGESDAAIRVLRDGLESMADEAATAEERLRNVTAATAEAGPSSQALTQSYIDQALQARNLADATDETTDAVEDLSDGQDALAAASDAAAASLEAAYKEIEDAATSLQNRVDSAMSSAASAMLSFSDDGKKHIGAFTDDLLHSLLDLALWQNNLITIAERGGAEFALQMAELGPAFAGAVDEIATAGDDDFAAAMSAMVGYTETGARDMAAEFAKVDPEFEKTLSGLDGLTKRELNVLQVSARREGQAIGRQIAEGTASGIDMNLHLITGAARGMVNGARGAARDAALIQSPSRLFAEDIGEPMAQGVTVGFEDEMRRSFGPAVGAALAPIGNYVTHHNNAPSSVSNTRTGVVVERMDVHEGAEAGALFRSANLILAGV